MEKLAALKKQMAALEAKMAKATKVEMGGAIAKVRAIMADFGLTIEHLTASVPKGRAPSTKGASKKLASSKVTAAKGSKPPKYRDPTTGVTWAGVGRAPGWIVGAKNRDDFLIARPESTEASAKRSGAAKKASKPAVSVKRAMAAAAAKKASRKTKAGEKAAPSAADAPAATKRAAVKKAAVKKVATAKKAVRATAKKVSAKSQAATSNPDSASATSEA